MKIEIVENNVVLVNPSNKNFEIHPLWLRERAKTENLVDKYNDQRLYDPSQLDPNIKIKKASMDNGHLNLEFTDGIKFEYEVNNLLYEIDRKEPTENIILWDSNLKEKPTKEDLEKWSETLDYIDIVSDLEKMDQSYDNDPLFGCGWSCESIPKLDIDHQLHLTYKYYSHNEYNIEHTRNYVNIPRRIYNWKRVIADTRDDNPENWKIIE